MKGGEHDNPHVLAVKWRWVCQAKGGEDRAARRMGMGI